MSALHFQLGEKVLVKALCLKQRVAMNRSSFITRRVTLPLLSLRVGVTGGHRSFAVGETVSDEDGPLFTRTGTIGCYLVAYKLREKPVEVKEDDLEKMND